MRTASSYLNFRLWPLKGLSIAALAAALAVILGCLLVYIIAVFLVWIIKSVTITVPMWLWSRILYQWPQYRKQVLAKGLSFQCISLGAIYSFGEFNTWLMAGYLTIVTILWLNQERKFKRGVNIEHALDVMHLTFLMPLVPVVYHLVYMPIHYRRIAAQCTAETLRAHEERRS